MVSFTGGDKSLNIEISSVKSVDPEAESLFSSVHFLALTKCKCDSDELIKSHCFVFKRVQICIRLKSAGI